MRAPDCVATPGKIIRKFVPSEEICAWIDACEPWPDRDHRDHAGHADDDAERRQRRAQLVARDRLQPDLQDGDELEHRASPTPRSPARRCAATAPVVDDQAVAEHHRPLGVLRDVRFVGDQHDRLAVVVEPLEHRHDLLGGLRVEVPGRLVGQDQLGIVDERPRDRDALLLAARELARVVVLAPGEADDLEAPARLLLALARRDASRTSRSAAAPRSRSPRSARAG